MSGHPSQEIPTSSPKTNCQLSMCLVSFEIIAKGNILKILIDQ